MDLGRIGIWLNKRHGTDVAGLVDELGFGTLWLGGSPSVQDARAYLERSERLVVATGILNVWQHEPDDVAAAHADLTADFPGRFLLGIGIGHPEATSDYRRPLKTMREFFDGLDAAGTPVPREERCAAALGPKMLDLAAERSLGTHPYFTTPDHTRFARERVGPDALVAPELTVVLDPDADGARRTAREFTSRYLDLRNYTGNLERFGFTPEEFRDGGSDRLVDAVIAHGTPAAVAEAVQAHLDAGADHVCVQLLGQSEDGYRALAEVLL